MSFLSAISPKSWLAIILLLAVLGIIGKMKYDAHEIATLEKNVVVDTVKIAEQADTIKTDGKVAKIDEEVHVDLAKAVSKAVVAHKAVEDKLDAREDVIAQHFDALPISPATVADEADQLSAARLTSLQEAYCLAVPEAASCSPPAPTTPEGATP